MRCPHCDSEDLKVIDSRSQPNSIKRRRMCLRCGYRFTTFERVEKRYPMIRKKDGSIEIYSPQKVRKGLENAFRKRKLRIEEIEKIFLQIDTDIANQTSAEIDSAQIGKLVLKIIQPVDMVAYLRFASVYCEVNTIDEFVALLPAPSSNLQQDF